MSQTEIVKALVVPPSRRPRTVSWAWLGVVPFFVFAIAFLLAPGAYIIFFSFQDNGGNFTVANIGDLFQPSILQAYWLSIRVSAWTAIGGGLFGFLMAYSAILGGLPRWVRTTLLTFSGVSANFAGVPLAFAFIATLGRVGMLTVFLRDVFNVNLYNAGFNLFTEMGLSLTYMYFQFPLMVLIISPALDGLKHEWREASENLGASTWQYWRYVALPILLPSLLGTMILLFGNAFGAYATAYSLTGGSLNLVTIEIGNEISGEVLHNVGLGYALAFGMVVIMASALLAYTLLQRRSERWLK